MPNATPEIIYNNLQRSHRRTTFNDKKRYVQRLSLASSTLKVKIVKDKKIFEIGNPNQKSYFNSLFRPQSSNYNLH